MQLKGTIEFYLEKHSNLPTLCYFANCKSYLHLSSRISLSCLESMAYTILDQPYYNLLMIIIYNYNLLMIIIYILTSQAKYNNKMIYLFHSPQMKILLYFVLVLLLLRNAINNIKLILNFLMKQSQTIAVSLINHVDHTVWQRIAEQQIKTMVPANIQKMNLYTFQTLIELNSNSTSKKKDKFSMIADKISLRRDNFLKNYLDIEKQQKISSIRQNDKIQSNSIKFKTTNAKNGNMESVSKSLASSQKIRESKIERFVQINSETDQIYNSIEDKQHGKKKQQQTYKTIEVLRNKLIFIEQAKKKQAQAAKQIEKMNAQRWQAMQKKKKQITKYAFDYNGQFFGSNAAQNPQNAANKITKLNLQHKELINQNYNSQIKCKPQLTQIVNERISQKTKRLKSQLSQYQNPNQRERLSLPHRFIDSFENDSDLQEGISIKQQSMNFRRNKPLVRTGQKISMPNFKRELANIRFKQFRIKPNFTTLSNKHSNKQNLLSERSEQCQSQQKKRQKTIESEVVKRKKESEQRKIKYKTTMSNQQSEFWNSKKRLNKSIKLRNRANERGLIRISNESLYESVCFNQKQ